MILSGLTACSLAAQSIEGLPAFPQAEGFGAYAKGGRGGKVIFVENLNDDGPGSLRAAVLDPAPRIVLFRVSGIIELQSELRIKHPYITIAGQTAPGDGICLKNFPLKIAHTHDVVVRGIRIRPGIELLPEGKSSDAIAVEHSRNVMIDHCSASWSTDEILNTNNQNSDVSIQWCLFAESLNHSVQQREHGYAATLGGIRTSFHHNLLAHNKGRNPSIGGGDRNRRSELDIRNNVVYNWVSRVCDGKPHAVNFVANYYRPGPATPIRRKKVVAEIQSSEKYGFHSKWYIADNHVEGFPSLTADNWNRAVQFRAGCSMEKNRAYTPFANAGYNTRDAKKAYLEVLEHAGVTVPKRDAVDRRIIDDVRSGRASVGNGIIDRVEQVGGWPELLTYDLPVDTDKDGMPDRWEVREGLDIKDPSDRSEVKTGQAYDNLERYLNELASHEPYLVGLGGAIQAQVPTPAGKTFETEVKASKKPLIAHSNYTIWIPKDTPRIRSILAINKRGAGKHLFEQDQEWRALAERTQSALLYCQFEAHDVRSNGYGESMLKACDQFAAELNRPELKQAPFVLWGHSMGGRVAQDFARFKPSRVIAIHIGLRANPSNPEFMREEAKAMNIPALYLMGAEDRKPRDIREHFHAARKAESPRAWIWLPGQGHWPKGMHFKKNETTPEEWREWVGNDVVIPWTEANLRLRLPESKDAAEGPIKLRRIDLESGWLGEIETGTIARYDEFKGAKSIASWFPNEKVARAWIRFSLPKRTLRR